MIHSENIAGLSSAEVAVRLKNDGLNTLPNKKKRNLTAIVTEALREPMFALLLCAASIYLLIGELHEGVFLLATVSYTHLTLPTNREV